MKRSAYASGLATLASTLFAAVAADPSIPVAYCASSNTADTSATSDTYQSQGLCYTTCNDDGYALGILQDSKCWCSNYVPAEDDQVDTSECENSCPGYPDDYCGGDGLYGYIKLSASVSGTAGGSSSTKTATSTTSSTILVSTEIQTTVRTETKTETVQDSVTTTSSSDLSTSTSLTSTKSSETTSSTLKTTTAKTTSTSSTKDSEATTTSNTNKQNQQTTITSVQTVTSAGTVIVQTVTTVADATNTGSGGLSKGAVAGLVIGILAAIAAFVAGAILYRRHKKNRQAQEQTPLGMAAHRRGSSAGIMSKAGTIASSGYGFDMMEDGGYGSPGRRVSMKPMDPRLDPKSAYGLYRTASHDSINTLRDDQDYSRRVHEPPRTLRVMNANPGDD